MYPLLKEIYMGYIHAEIELSNPREPGLNPLKARALVDSGALSLCIPAHVQLQLRLEEEAEKREITTADGRKSVVS